MRELDIIGKVPEIAIVIACVAVAIKLFVDSYEKINKASSGTRANMQPCKDHGVLITDVAIIKERIESVFSLLKEWESQSKSDLDKLYDRMRFVESKIAVIEKQVEA